MRYIEVQTYRMMEREVRGVDPTLTKCSSSLNAITESRAAIPVTPTPSSSSFSDDPNAIIGSLPMSARTHTLPSAPVVTKCGREPDV